MHPTSYLDMNALLDNLLFQMQQVLGANLVGLYLYGSLVTGDFNPECSDIDLLAVTGSDGSTTLSGEELLFLFWFPAPLLWGHKGRGRHTITQQLPNAPDVVVNPAAMPAYTARLWTGSGGAYTSCRSSRAGTCWRSRFLACAARRVLCASGHSVAAETLR